MKFLVLGCGSIGSRHIANIQKILPTSEIDVYDPQKELKKKFLKNFTLMNLNKSHKINQLMI